MRGRIAKLILTAIVMSSLSAGEGSAMSERNETSSGVATLAEAKENLGNPLSEQVFVMTPLTLNEFRIELRNVVDEEEILAGKTEVTEVTWQPDPGKRRTIWFRTSDGSYLHTLDWFEGDEF